MFAYAKQEQKKESKDTAQKEKTEKVASTPNLTGIPAVMKTRFENLSGFSFDDVRVHYNSDKPAQLQALAYTQGNQVYIGSGQEKHLSHELGHIVQQKRGIVHPTTIIKGLAVNTDSDLETIADKMEGGPYQPNKSTNESRKSNDIVQLYRIVETWHYRGESHPNAKDFLLNCDTGNEISNKLYNAQKRKSVGKDKTKMVTFFKTKKSEVTKVWLIVSTFFIPANDTLSYDTAYFTTHPNPPEITALRYYPETPLQAAENDTLDN